MAKQDFSIAAPPPPKPSIKENPDEKQVNIAKEKVENTDVKTPVVKK